MHTINQRTPAISDLHRQEALFAHAHYQHFCDYDTTTYKSYKFIFVLYRIQCDLTLLLFIHIIIYFKCEVARTRVTPLHIYHKIHV